MHRRRDRGCPTAPRSRASASSAAQSPVRELCTQRCQGLEADRVLHFLLIWVRRTAAPTSYFATPAGMTAPAPANVMRGGLLSANSAHLATGSATYRMFVGELSGRIHQGH
jgi:hypothetical protein